LTGLTVDGAADIPAAAVDNPAAAVHGAAPTVDETPTEGGSAVDVGDSPFHNI